MAELNPGRTCGQHDGARFVVHQRLEVEHLEDALEADQRGHHVDLHVRQRGERAIQATEQRGEGHQGAEPEVAGDDPPAAGAVDQGGGQ